MLTWVLILTLNSSSGAAIGSVPGFVSRADCEIAGRTWREAQTSREYGANWICAQQRERVAAATEIERR